jgi:hypothetical protein
MCFDRLSIGSPGLDVFRQVVRLNPDVSDISLVLYDSTDNSDDRWSKNQSLVWLPKAVLEGDSLKQIAISNFRNSHLLLAAGSKVKMDHGSFAHIPMMDLNNELENSELTPDQILSKFSSLRGVLLATDHSYHMWCPNLMREEAWTDLMVDRERVEAGRNTTTGEPICDTGFIKKSLERGFAGLRIFGYERTEKISEPQVVAISK